MLSFDNDDVLFFTSDPVLGRVLRTKRMFQKGEKVFEEEPFLSFSGISGPFQNDLAKFVKSLAKKKDCVNFGEAALRIVIVALIKSLEESPERIRVILNHFYLPSENPIREPLINSINALYVEVQRLLLLPQYQNEGFALSHEFDVQTVISLYSIIGHNAHGSDGDNGGLYLKATLMAHDCAANVGPFPDHTTPGRLNFIALEPLEPGDVLTMSYLPPEKHICPTLVRRKHLFAVKQFWCYCNRCLADDVLRSLSCPTEGCAGYILNSLLRKKNGEKHWECNSCRSTFWGLDYLTPEETSRIVVEPIIQLEYVLMSDVIRQNLLGEEIDCKEIIQKLTTVTSRIGTQHWLYAYYSLEGCEVPSLFLRSPNPLEGFGNWALQYLESPYTQFDAGRILFSYADRFRVIGVESSWLMTTFCTAYRLMSPERGVIANINESLAPLDNIFLSHCSHCGVKKRKGGSELLICSRCRRVKYCNQRCQKKDWQERHKLLCGCS
jgi:hypothetical protein